MREWIERRKDRMRNAEAEIVDRVNGRNMSIWRTVPSLAE